MISFVIPLLNRYAHFSQCLSSIEMDRPNAEVVVADFGSVDGDVELRLKRSGLRTRLVILDGPFVRTVALNAGAQAATGDTLFFLDADMLVPRKFASMVDAFVRDGQTWFPQCYVMTQDKTLTTRDPKSTNGYGNVGITKFDFGNIGGWNEGFRQWGGEDGEFVKRVRSYDIAVVRDVVEGLIHQWHPDMRGTGPVRLEVKDLNVRDVNVRPPIQKPIPPPPTVLPGLVIPVANHKRGPTPEEIMAAAPSGLDALLAAAEKIMAEPEPEPAPIDLGSKPIGEHKGKDVLLATYNAEHASYAAHLRPWFERQGFDVYEKTGTRDYSWLAREKATIIVAWNMARPEQQAFLEYVRQHCCDFLLSLEIGWFPGCSKETGSAETLYLDRKGINARSEIRDFTPPPCSLEMEEAVKAYCKEHAPRKPGRKAYTFIPLQLENDTNITEGSPHFKRMQDLIDFVEEHVPGRLVFKQHPRDEKGRYTVRNRKSALVQKGDLADLIARSKSVVGINSTVLLESMLWGKKVAAFGKGLFTGHDVVLDCSDDPEEVFKIVKEYRQDEKLVARRTRFLHELIFRRQIELDHVAETMDRNRVMQEVLAACQQ